MTTAPVVIVVDADPAVRSSLQVPYRQRLQVESFDSAEAFSSRKLPDVPSALFLSFFFTARGEEKIRTQALRAGAVKFLTKPLDRGLLLGAVGLFCKAVGREALRSAVRLALQQNDG